MKEDRLKGGRGAAKAEEGRLRRRRLPCDVAGSLSELARRAWEWHGAPRFRSFQGLTRSSLSSKSGTFLRVPTRS